MISKVITINLIKTCYQLLDLSVAVLLTQKIVKQTFFTKNLFIFGEAVLKSVKEHPVNCCQCRER